MRGRFARNGRRHRGAIARKLGVAILSGLHAPGEMLPSAPAAADTLDVSRSAYREAIQVLTAKGLVESRPKMGTRVLPRRRWNPLDPDILAWAFPDRPAIGLVCDLFELRMIEPGAARLAAERRDRADVKRIQPALGLMRRHALATDEGQQADREFHTALLEATRNDVVIALGASVGAAVNATTVFRYRGAGLPRDPIPEHALVFDAVAAGDGAAAEHAMRSLIQHALADTRG